VADTWILGLDGGGSKTALAYLNQRGQVSGPFYAPGINPFDRPGWAAEFAGFVAAYPAPGPLVAATLGLPGYGESPAITAQQQSVCRRLIPVPHTLMNDVQAAFSGAFPAGVGALLLSGTGSMAWASDGTRHVRTGGWGDAFGDEGSAYWIGRQALGLASQGLDGRHPDSEFARLLLESTLEGPPTPAQLLQWYHALPHPRSGVAALARTVNDLAVAGQPTALGLLDSAAQELARHVQSVWAQLGSGPLPWSFAGSVLGSPPLLAALTRLLGPPLPPALPPLGGPLYHAALQAGHDPVWTLNVLTHALAPAQCVPPVPFAHDIRTPAVQEHS
jgi:glucosamine kinase